MNEPAYTPEQLQGKFVACSLMLDPPALDAVRYATGPNKGLPVLYNCIDEAQEDKFFDDSWDKVIPAEEYFLRVSTNNFKF